MNEAIRSEVLKKATFDAILPKLMQSIPPAPLVLFSAYSSPSADEREKRQDCIQCMHPEELLLNLIRNMSTFFFYY